LDRFDQAFRLTFSRVLMLVCMLERNCEPEVISLLEIPPLNRAREGKRETDRFESCAYGIFYFFYLLYLRNLRYFFSSAALVWS